MLEILRYDPAVFAVGDEYVIITPVKESSLFWIKVGDKCYYDHSNGVLRSMSDIHKVRVPARELDAAGEYTVFCRRMIERKPYFSETSDVLESTYRFLPVGKLPIRLYHISDSHGLTDEPIASAAAFEAEFGKIDALVLNGDVVNHSGALENFDAFYKIASGITHGEKPVVFSRGNHDMRGIFAEKIEDYTPTRDGCSYFSFRLGAVWGLVLDCAEDKDDSNAEYGNTVCCRAFRDEQTEYLRELICTGESEYNSPDVEKRLIIAHAPFTKQNSAPFNIEEDVYRLWAELIAKNIEPDLMLCGHTHETKISLPGSPIDNFGQPCPLIIGSKPDVNQKKFTGCGIILDERDTLVAFCDEVANIKTSIIRNGDDANE